MKQIIYKFIYSPFINQILRSINKLLSPIFPNIQLPPSGKVKTVTKFGQSVLFSTNQTNYTTHLIYWNGLESFEYTNIFEDLSKKCSCFIDIGANTGHYSILAAIINSSITVHAFEPAHSPYIFLEENIELNNLRGRVHPHKIALSDKDGEITFYEMQNEKYQWLEHNLGGVGNFKEVKTDIRMTQTIVPTTTLDSFVKEHSISEITLMKIDTEATEHIILSGAADVLQHIKPIIICETLFNQIELQLDFIMTKYGYEFYNYQNGALYKANSIVRSVDNGVRDCFFVHPSRFSLIEEFVRS
ncbi:MAG: FkbM family methyltransferase [Candidatus Kapaibacterium sp.]|nr:FkbM family methyltransferase [Bacteroidota bacterium]